MVFKIVSPFWQLGRGVIVTDGTAGLLPDLFLRVQFGRGNGIFDDLQARVGSQYPLSLLVPMLAAGAMAFLPGDIFVSNTLRLRGEKIGGNLGGKSSERSNLTPIRA